MSKTLKTINRGTLRKQIEKGNVLIKCNYHYTDDYKYDNDNNFGETDWLVAGFRKEFGEYKKGMYLLNEFELTCKGGLAYTNLKTNENNLIVHSNLSYEFKYKEVK